MGIQEVANKVYKHYVTKPDPEENMEGLASSIARWTNFNYSESLIALNESRIIFSTNTRDDQQGDKK